jgi:hypothetical protein
MAQELIMPTPTISEVREEQASHEVAVIYSDIRRCMRLPLVNLVYRHLATVPGALAWVWSGVRSLILSGELDASLDRLLQNLPIPRLESFDLTFLGDLESVDRSALGRTLHAYNRGNGLNLIALTTVSLVLRTPARGITGISREPPPYEVRRLPRLLKVAELDAETADRVKNIAILHSGGPGVIPSLYLHLANWPRFLNGACDRISPLLVDGSLERVRKTACDLAQAEARHLLAVMEVASSNGAPISAQAVAVIERFKDRVIPEMLPIGLALSHFLKKPAVR